MKTSSLHILFNEFYPDRPTHYVEIDAEGNTRDLKRKPRAARFSKVTECGCGGRDSSHLSFCTKSRQVFGHRLQK